MGTFDTIYAAKASGTHMTIKCTCGAVLDNCRCVSLDGQKPVNYVQDGCPECKAKART